MIETKLSFSPRNIAVVAFVPGNFARIASEGLFTKYIFGAQTHAGRGSGARSAELKGVSEAQIRRAGRWIDEQMTGKTYSYLRNYILEDTKYKIFLGCHLIFLS